MRADLPSADRTARVAAAQASYDAGALEDARAACDELLAANPDDPHALVLRARIAADEGTVVDGLRWAARAIAADPSEGLAHYAAGRLLEMENRLPEAEASYRQAVARAPGMAKAHNNLGVVLQMQGRIPEALAFFRRAVELEPSLPEANQNYASIARDPAAMRRAVDGLLERLAGNPRDPGSYNSLANAYRELGRHEEALDCYAKAIALEPEFAEAHFNRAHVLLQCGRYREGWQEYEWRLRMPTHSAPAHRFTQPMWHGRETAHTVLLHAEQGLGDTIQFARYAALAAPRCGTVILECQPELQPLLEAMKHAPQVIARGDPLPPFEMHAPLMSLPALFGTTLETIPWSGRYLGPTGDRVIKWRKAFRKRAKRVNVGLVWAGRPQHWDDFNRSIPLSRLAPLASSEDVGFFSLQIGPEARQAASPPPGMELFDLTSKIEDFGDTAAIVSFLDVVVSVDTSVAHLAGAMGIPVWVLVPFAPDWRHHLEREDNPWYPTMRLFRQPRDGDWDGAIARLAEALATLVRQKTT